MHIFVHDYNLQIIRVADICIKINYNLLFGALVPVGWDSLVAAIVSFALSLASEKNE